MILYCHKCLSSNKKELEYWQGIFDYIMVDEFQDTGTLQAEIIYMVADLRKNVCVVGDDDQSIYGFRGADSSIFKEFSRKYPGSVQIILGTNYRSLPYIIEGADKVIRNNENRIVKNMSAYRQGEGKVHIRQTASYGRQADMAVSLINDYVKTGGHLSDIAILYRVKKEASVLVNTLETIGMPFFTRAPGAARPRGGWGASDVAETRRAALTSLTDREREIERIQDMKARLSTKMLGESLEQHCEIEFNRLRPRAFPRAYFEKDNEVVEGTKGDFVFRDFDEEGNEIVSIMFEMKNEADDSTHRKTNESHFKKLDADRRKKGFEYAVLVSLLETDNELYASGITDVSYRIQKI